MANACRERIYGVGRPIPGYSLDINSGKVCSGKIEEYIMELINGEAFGYGYYNIHILLERRYHLIISPKKVYRLCKKLDILKHQRQVKVKYSRHIAKNWEITDGKRILSMVIFWVKDCSAIYQFETYIQAYTAIINYMGYYNNVRIHSLLKYLPPAKQYLAALSGKIGPYIVKVQHIAYFDGQDKFFKYCLL